jgi:hypothetical protein
VLAEPTAANQSVLISTFKNAQEESTKLSAALSLIRIDPIEVPADALTLILKAALHQGNFEELEQSCWAKVEEMELLIRQYLSLLQNPSAIFAIDWLAKMLPSQGHPQALAIAEVLLNLVFQGPIPKASTFTSLPEIQQRVLRIIAENRNVWVQNVGGEPAKSVKTSLLMRLCGLPDNLESFISFANSSEQI